MTLDFIKKLQKLQRLFLIVGIVASGISLTTLVGHRAQFLQSYLVAYMFWFGIGVGSLAILMIHHLTKGRWGFVIQRILEASTKTMPLLAILFVPILMGIQELYIWSDPEMVRTDHFIEHKVPFLNVPFFVGRTVFYFIVWILMCYFLNKWSTKNDEQPTSRLAEKMRLASGPGLVGYALTMSFASIDWIMSLDPHWYSTGYGLIFIVGQGLMTFAFGLVVLNYVRDEPELQNVVKMERFWDLGNMMFAFVMLWGYMSLSHFLIVWSGNLPEEITWYLSRTSHGWEYVVWSLVIFHFVLPFMILLHRRSKQNSRRLLRLASLILVIRLVELHWLITPSFSHGGPGEHHGVSLHWLDITLPIGIGGLWLAAFCYFLKAQPLLPKNDPLLEEALRHG